MKRQPYYPKNLGDQPEWHSNFARKPPGHAATLVPGQAEVREYRARFWDDGKPSSDWCSVLIVTVRP